MKVKRLELTWGKNSAQQIFLCIVLPENIVFYLLSSCEIDTRVYVYTYPPCNLRHCKFLGYNLSCLELYLSHCKITLTVINSNGNWQAFEKEWGIFFSYISWVLKRQAVGVILSQGGSEERTLGPWLTRSRRVEFVVPGQVWFQPQWLPCGYVSFVMKQGAIAPTLFCSLCVARNWLNTSGNDPFSIAANFSQMLLLQTGTLIH